MRSLATRAGALPRATLAASLILVASATIAFGFVVQRGGLLMPVASPGAESEGAGGAPTPSLAAGVTEPPAPTLAPTQVPTTDPPVAPTPVPNARSTPSPAVAPTSVPTAAPTPRPTPRPSSSGASAGTPSASRLALLTKCPGKSDCWIYTIRAGDNLWSIVQWFGVSMDRVLALNPWLGPQQIVRAGQELIIPTPTR